MEQGRLVETNADPSSIPLDEALEYVASEHYGCSYIGTRLDEVFNAWTYMAVTPDRRVLKAFSPRQLVERMRAAHAHGWAILEADEHREAQTA